MSGTDHSDTVILTKAAYAVAEWADACSLSVGDLRKAISERTLTVRLAPSGRCLITAEDGMLWLRTLPVAPAKIEEQEIAAV